MDLITLLPLVLKASIVLIVFSIGLGATRRDATYLLRHPRHLASMVLAMNIVMPMLAVAVAVLFDLHPAVKIALIALAVSPVPPILPKKVMSAGGEEDYTIGLLVAAALLAIVFVPLTMELCARILGMSLSMPPAAVAKVVLTSVLAPLVLGMIVAGIAPLWAGRIAKPLSIGAMALLAAGILPVLFSAWGEIISLIGNGTILAFTAFCLTGLATGHLLGGPRLADRTVLAIATATRHPAVAILIAHANFPNQKLVLPAVLLYLIVGGLVSLPYLKWAKHQEALGTAVTHA